MPPRVLNPYLKHVKHSVGNVKKFPHRIATEYPEEWLCRVLAALEVILKDSTKGGNYNYTRQYAVNYLQIAQVALKEVMAERVDFLHSHAVLPAEELRAEIDDLTEQLKRAKAETALLSELVRARSHSAFDRVAGVLQSLETGSPRPADPPSPPSGLIARTTPLKTRSAERRLFAAAHPSRSLQEHLAQVDSQPGPDSSGSSSQSSGASRGLRAKGN